MKKILFFLFASIVLFSCSRDDDSNSNSNSDSVVGSWYIYSVGLNGTLSNGSVSSPINVTQVASSCVQKSTLIFNQTGAGSVMSWDDSSGSCVQVQNDNFTYTYDSSSKVLKIMVGSETDITNIKSITSSEMIGEETVSNYEVQGYTFSGKITTTMKKK
ncbi:MAG TPA: hypothetical protein DIT47_01550 [Flavobacteriaceae bacterium]|nr:hypothetical protein [Flavobacteriaceae bacterium]